MSCLLVLNHSVVFQLCLVVKLGESSENGEEEEDGEDGESCSCFVIVLRHSNRISVISWW